MSRLKHFLLISTIGLLLFFFTNTYAFSYSFYVDKFILTGNLPYYFVDNFNNNVVTWPWIINEPTVTESNGFLKLSSPGDTILKSFHGYTASIESTTVISKLLLINGCGNCVATSMWLPILPKKDQMFFMEAFHTLALYNTESISIGVSRLSPSIANVLGFPSVSSNIPMIFFGSENLDGGSVNFQAIPINPNDITGEIALQIIFDDLTNQFKGAFSLDGGNTFQSPFNPVSPQSFNQPFVWAMNAVSCDPTPEPKTVFYFMIGLIGITIVYRKTIFTKM